MSLPKNTTSAQLAADLNRVASELSIDVLELSRSKYEGHGGLYSSRQFIKHGGLGFIRNAFFGKMARNEGEVRAVQQVNTELSRLRRLVGDKDALATMIAQVVEKMPPVKVAYRPKQNKAVIERSLNFALSDTHWGSDLTLAEHLRKHGAEQEAAALWSVVKNVCEYKLEHRRKTELVLNVLGDIIENELHGPAGAAPLHLQACRAIYLLSQTIAFFASSFPKVRVVFAVGNHGRDVSIHPKRATHQKFNAVETTIYYAVKAACRALSNVEFIHPMTPWADYHVQGHRVYATHGDTNLSPGNPGSKIDVKSLGTQTNNINASLKDREEYKVFLTGHVHQAMVTQLPNGAFLITNGALVPPGGFAQSLNIMEAPLNQVLWETTEEHPVGDFRFITADVKIKGSKIKPFYGLGDF